MCLIASIPIGVVIKRLRKSLKTYVNQGCLNVKSQLGSIELLWQNIF